MKKMVFMAAFVAATAAFVACSSNDDLVQQKPDVPEEQIEEGTPMKIIVSDLATRGTDFSSTNPLTKFKLYSSLDSYWTAGKLMEYKNDAWTTNNSLTWDDEDEHTFFAINVEEDEEFADIAENSGAGDDHPDLPVVTATTCSFNYKMPISVKPKADPGEADEYYYNSEDLKDLLVAKSIGGAKYEPVYNDPVNGETKYEAGSLFVNFQHALAQITAIKVYVNYTRLGKKGFSTSAADAYAFRISGARIGGIKAMGTYTFDRTTGTPAKADPWDVTGADAEFEIPLVQEDFDNGVFYAKHTNDVVDIKKELPLTDGGFYIIPQIANGSITSSPTEGIVNGCDFGVVGPYIEFDAQVSNVNVNVDELQSTGNSATWRVGHDLNNPSICFKWDQDASDKMGYGQIRCPLKFQKLEAGKGYALVIDLGMAVIYTNGDDDEWNNGEAIFTGLDINAG